MTFPRTLLSSKQLLPKKHMGQNFLLDPSTAEMIVRRAGVRPTDVALEIGAGLGALTVPLARSVKKVYAVEKDRDLIELLSRELADNQILNTQVINRNIFDVDITEIAEREGGKLLVFGNLPYNISSQVVFKLVASREYIERAVFMFQKELARRIAAPPGTGDYGRLSVMVQYSAAVSRLAGIAAHQFYPRPQVDSEVIEIRFESPREPAVDETLFSAVVKAAFGRRRKTLKNAMNSSELEITGNALEAVWQKSGIDSSRRAETLNVQEFVVLANAFSQVYKELPG